MKPTGRDLIRILHRTLGKITERKDAVCTEAQRKLDEDTIAEARRLKPRAKDMTLEKAIKVAMSWRLAELDSRRAELEPTIDRYLAAEERLRKLLDSTADIERPLPGAVQVVAYYHYTGAYSSQGYAAERYLRVRLGMAVTALHRVGLAARIEEKDGKATGNVTVGVEDAEVDGIIAKARASRGLDLRESVRCAWANGCNPRVFWSFLPHGYEEKNGLDFFGGEVRS
jgi:hypothetical protein